MMFLAKKRNSELRDLGMDLLVLKEKAEIELLVTSDLIGDSEVLLVKNPPSSVELTHLGFFRVLLDYKVGEIAAFHYQSAVAATPRHTVKGENAEAVMWEVMRRGLVSSLDYAAYLRGDLRKAEVALRTGEAAFRTRNCLK